MKQQGQNTSRSIGASNCAGIVFYTNKEVGFRISISRESKHRDKRNWTKNWPEKEMKIGRFIPL